MIPEIHRKKVAAIKRLFAILLSAVVILTVFTACSGKSDDNTKNTISTIATEEAKIKDSDAVKFIEQSYTKEELGLDKVDKDYSFMVASSGVDIDGEKYVKVVANVIVKNNETTEDGKDTFSMETMGEYYISFDGEKILKKDMNTNEYSQLENRYDAYNAKREASTQSKSDGE